MRRVILLRHGRTAANEQRLYCGRTDVSLSDAGRRELLELRGSRSYPRARDFRAYTSGLLRTEETLELLFGPLPHEAVPGLREMDFGRFEMRSYDELKDCPDYRAWCSGDNERNRCPGGESGEEMSRRVLAAYRELLAVEGDILCVCHGGPIAAIMAHLFPEEGKSRYQWQPRGGCGYELRYTGESPAGYREIPE